MKIAMKPFSLLLLALLLCGLLPAEAQSLSAFKQELARPHIDSLTGRRATVIVSEDGRATAALAQNRPLSTKWRAAGWRICIFSDNTANARSGARNAITLFQEHFPQTPVYDEYASPYFRVSVGNCLTSEEAIILLERVKPHFPKAFIKQEQLSLEELLR